MMPLRKNWLATRHIRRHQNAREYVTYIISGQETSLPRRRRQRPPSSRPSRSTDPNTSSRRRDAAPRR